MCTESIKHNIIIKCVEESKIFCEALEKAEEISKARTNYYGELLDADPECCHKIVNAPGGGIKCTKCGGWFCF